MLRTEFVTFLSRQRYIYINKQIKKTIFIYNFYKYVLIGTKILLAPVFPSPRCSSTSDVRKNG